jgi:acetolactate synthase regulatory subunit
MVERLSSIVRINRVRGFGVAMVLMMEVVDRAMVLMMEVVDRARCIFVL